VPIYKRIVCNFLMHFGLYFRATSRQLIGHLNPCPARNNIVKSVTSELEIRGRRQRFALTVCQNETNRQGRGGAASDEE